MVKGIKKKKLVACVLYLLPILFFFVAYFGLVSTGEDILQGAGNLRNGTEINFIGDVVASFNNNARLTDMYAWSTIDFFDYQFSFGVDTIFRLVDVAMAVGVLYLLTYLAVGHRPRLTVRDSTVFGGLFLSLILTQHGRILYAGFSTVHNYMIGLLVFLLFIAPYFRWLREGKSSQSGWTAAIMVVLGVAFGMSAALTPLAVIIASLLYVIYMLIRRKFTMPVWAALGLIGAVAGFAISNLLGPGAGNYMGNELYTSTYDYIGLSEIFSGVGITKVFLHLFYNFGRVLIPTIVIMIGLMLCSKKPFSRMKEFCRPDIIGMATVAVILMMGSFQVNAPLRILLPAYVLLVIAVWRVFREFRLKVVGSVVTTATLLVVGIKFILVADYSRQSAAVFEDIKNSNEERVCVERDKVKSLNFPVIYLGQEDIVMEWALPETIYGKAVVFCGD